MSFKPDEPDSSFRPPWMDISPQEGVDSSSDKTVGKQAEPAAVQGESGFPQVAPEQASSSPPSPQFQPPVGGEEKTPPQIPPASRIPVVSSPFRKIIPFLGIGIIILLIVFVVRTILTKKDSGSQVSSKKGAKKEVSLTYWGLWEPAEIMQPILDEYKKQHPEVSINYVFHSHKDYRERLQSALAADKGPDIMRIHLSWLPMFKNQLSPVPEGLVDFSDYYPVVSQLKIDDKYYALPLEFDSLALFYNTDIFAAASQSPPTSWEELRKSAVSLTVRDSKGKIQTGGIALGTTSNIDHWSDILALMMLQNGADLTNPTGKLAEDALKFYTLFSKVDKVWDESLPSSVYAFATGKAAMIFAPSWRVFEIKEIDPKLNFKIVPVPQLPGSQVAWATFWVEGVSKTSPNQEAVFEFLKYLSQKETLKKLYTYQSQVRLFGEPYPLKSLAGELKSDPVVGAFVAQGPYAQSWYLCSRTHDNGINERMIKYFEDAVNGVLRGKGVDEALAQTAAGVSQILNQYQVITSPQ